MRVTRCLSCGSFANDSMSVCPTCGGVLEAYPSFPAYLPQGTLLDHKYEVRWVLGSGGFGITYLCLDISLSKLVAIKEYFPRGTQRDGNDGTHALVAKWELDIFRDGQESFKEEAQKLVKLDIRDMPAIPDVYALFDGNNTSYYVMEYLKGKTLRQLIEARGVMTLDDAVELLRPIFSTLSKLHDKGIIHRDISPNNIIISHGRASLVDFGCARKLGSATGDITTFIKAGYTPIEQYEGRRQDARADVYALSATIYECICGECPPTATSRIEHDTLKNPSSFGVDIGRNQEDALLKGLSVRPVDRTRTINMLLSGLENNDEPETMVVQPVDYEQLSREELIECASKGDNKAQYQLATLLLNEGELEEAESWYKLAIELGNTEAKLGLAVVFYKQGNLSEAEHLCKESLALRVKDAIPLFGLILRDRGKIEEAEEWLRTDASQGSIVSQAWLGGLLHELGRIDEAMEWYRRAANQGHPDAQFQLGIILKDRNEIDEANKWLRAAANHDNPILKYKVGSIFEQRLRATHYQELPEIVMYYRDAANKGVSEAKEWLANFGLQHDTIPDSGFLVIRFEKKTMKNLMRYASGNPVRSLYIDKEKVFSSISGYGAIFLELSPGIHTVQMANTGLNSIATSIFSKTEEISVEPHSVKVLTYEG